MSGMERAVVAGSVGPTQPIPERKIAAAVAMRRMGRRRRDAFAPDARRDAAAQLSKSYLSPVAF